jgi:hypothetical protein
MILVAFIGLFIPFIAPMGLAMLGFIMILEDRK